MGAPANLLTAVFHQPAVAAGAVVSALAGVGGNTAGLGAAVLTGVTGAAGVAAAGGAVASAGRIAGATGSAGFFLKKLNIWRWGIRAARWARKKLPL